MTDLTKLVLWSPLLALIALGFIAFLRIGAAADRAMRHLAVRHREDLPVFLRWNRWNIVFYPECVAPEGTADWWRVRLTPCTVAELFNDT